MIEPLLKRDKICIWLTRDQRHMLDWLHVHQRRTRGGVIRLAIERVYQAETARLDAQGRASGAGRVQ